MHMRTGTKYDQLQPSYTTGYEYVIIRHHASLGFLLGLLDFITLSRVVNCFMSLAIWASSWLCALGMQPRFSNVSLATLHLKAKSCKQNGRGRGQMGQGEGRKEGEEERLRGLCTRTIIALHLHSEHLYSYFNSVKL